MEPWLWIDGAVVPWVDDPDQLTADAIEAMGAWSFAWHDERNLVMLCEPDAGPISERRT